MLHIMFGKQIFVKRKLYKTLLKKIVDLDELSAELHSKAQTDAAFQEVSKECSSKVAVLSSCISGPKYVVDNLFADIDGFIQATKAKEDPAQVLLTFGSFSMF